MGMAVAEPPALLVALASRVENGSIEALKLWYFHSMSHAAETVLRYELLDRVRPHCMFLSNVERALIQRGDAEGGHRREVTPGGLRLQTSASVGRRGATGREDMRVGPSWG